MPTISFSARVVLGWTIAITMLGTPLAAQRALASRRDLVNRYYEAYSKVSRDHARYMDSWLAFFEDSVFFEDPTAGLRGTGRDSVRRAFTDALSSGAYGSIDFRPRRFVEGGDWVAVEGVLSFIRSGKPVTARFSTWLRFRGDRIVHQIDYVGYRDSQTRQKQPSKPNASAR